MNHLYLKVEVYAGADCREAIHQMAALAAHMRIPVEAKMNGVTVCAQPFCDSRALGDAWEAEMVAPDKPFKYVSGKPFNLIRNLEQQASEGEKHG